MLRKLEELAGRTLDASDGEIGEVRGFYFDDRSWALRYLVADTSSWADNREVLIPLECFTDVDWSSHRFPVQLTREQVRKAPGVDAHKPVGRAKEEEIIRSLGWPVYEYVRAAERRPLAGIEAGLAVAVEEKEETHLRSTGEITGYAVHALDGEIGTVHGFLVDDTCWQVRYLVVDIGPVLTGRKVLLSPEWVEGVAWEDAVVNVGMLTDTIKNSPAYDGSRPPGRAEENALCDYYHLPKYWRK